MGQEQKRLDYLDAAKAVALLLVIYGHTFRDSMRTASAWCAISYIFVYRFHVSLLFVISGMSYALSAERNLRLTVPQYLKKKAHSLLLPWFSYSVLIYAVFVLVQLIPPCRALLASTAYRFLSPLEYGIALLRNENPYSFHLWYLQTLFLFIFVTFLMDRFLPQRTVRGIRILLILTLPWFYTVFCQSWVWTFKGFFQKYLFFLLGTLLPPRLIERRAPLLSTLGTVGGVFLFWKACVPFPEALYQNVLTVFSLIYLDDLAITALCLGILAVCYLLREKLHRLSRFGQDTMLYYLYHQPFCCALLGMILYDKLHLPTGVVVAACMAAGLAVPALLRRAFGLLGIRDIVKKLGLPV